MDEPQSLQRGPKLLLNQTFVVPPKQSSEILVNSFKNGSKTAQN